LAVLLLAGLTFGCGGGSSPSNGDGTPPTAPSALAAAAENQQVSLTWTASSGATSYHVKQAITSGGPYTQVGSATAPSYTDTGLTNGAKYFYVVSALKASGESANSSEASGTPALPVPALPTVLAATAGNQQVSLTWSASSGATSYRTKRATTSGGPYTQVGAPTSASYTDAGLANGTTYYYVVSALNATGESANSSQASATPSPAPDVTITVLSTKTKPISPWIYGLNFYTDVSGAPPHLTLDRAGGNRWTAYNWETNASNAGSDYLYEKWYSEATDGTTRVINLNGSNLTDAQVQAIVQSPRSLWDPTYTENSWITTAVLGDPIRLLTRLQAKIDAEFPGTKISITEYENGGDNHIAGTIARRTISASSAARGCSRRHCGPWATALIFWRDSARSAVSMERRPASATPRWRPLPARRRM
jgi:hypothetical protein